MEPLSAISLATSIVQFVDFATKIVHGTRQIYETGTGAAAENADIELCASELQSLCVRLETDKMPLRRSHDDEALCRLADRCVTVSNDLLALLKRLRAKDTTSKWQCMVSAVKTQIKKSEKDELLARLSQCRAQLDLQLSRMANLDSKAFNERVLLSLQLNDETLQRLLEHLRRLRANVTICSLSSQAEAQLRRLFALPEDSRTLITARRVLNLLQFEDMHERFDDVGGAHKGTFSWALDHRLDLESTNIFNHSSNKGQRTSSELRPRQSVLLEGSDPSVQGQPAEGEFPKDRKDPIICYTPTTSQDKSRAIDGTLSTKRAQAEKGRNIFTNWLQTGTGVFHFVGTSGAGKSTLMKFLYDHPKTAELLGPWVNSRKLVVVKFFMWKDGTKKQRTLAGLCRSMLHDILEECPELTPKALPDIWEQTELTPWQDATICQTYCFAFFIDGLDEHREENADHDDLAKLILSWTSSSSGHVKICLASRPSHAFMEAFDNNQRLSIHDQTWNDRTKFVLDRLCMTNAKSISSGAELLALPELDQRMQKIAERIAEKSDGDFRQLSLVTRRLKQELDNNPDSLPLERRLQDIPLDDLEQLVDNLVLHSKALTNTDLIYMPDQDAHKTSTLDFEGKWFIGGFPGASSSYALSRPTMAFSHSIIGYDSMQSGDDTLPKRQIEEVEKWLGASANLDDDLFSAKDARMAGTCEWFTAKDSYRSWQSFNPDTPKILWITGQPAAGKSTLAGHIIEALQQTNSGCSFFFFKYGDKSKSRVSTCLKSLASQMARRITQVREKLLPILRDSLSTSETNNERLLWHKLFLNGIFKVPLERQYWILDGLDECEDSIATFKSILSKTDDSIPLRILVTSRETSTLRSEFVSLSPQLYYREDISTTDTLPDIKLFVEAKAKALFSLDEESRKKLVKKVVAKSKGSFLWTSLVLKELSQSYSEDEINQVLEDVPRDMEPLYQRTLETMSHSTGGKALAKAILVWNTCATRPLKLDELDGALKADNKEKFTQLEATIMALCGQLVVVDKLGNVQLVHETAREFLLNDTLQSEFAVDKKEAHTYIAKACLEYLIGEEMKPPRSTRRVTTSAKKRAAFSAYACVNFSYHLAQADELSGEILAHLNRFLSANILSWIEIIARTSDLNPIIQASKNLKRYVSICAVDGDLQNIRTWSTDLIRISARFADALITAPSAIFSLIPPLCPTNSAINKASQQGRGLTVVGFANHDWGNRLSCIAFRALTSSICYGDDFFAVGLTNGTVALYHATTGQEYKTLNHGEPVTLLLFLNRSGLLASCGRKLIRVWDVSCGETRHTFQAPQQCLCLAYEKEVLFAACDKNYLAFWDLKNDCARGEDKPWNAGDEFADSQLRRPASAVSISLEHKMLAIASLGSPIILWSLEDDDYYGSCGKKLASGEPSGHLVTALAFNPNPALELLVASYLDGELVLLDPFNDGTLETVRANCPKLAASPDGRLLAGAAGSGTIDVYGFESLRLVYRIKSSNLYIKQLCFSKDSLHFVDIRGAQCNVWEPAALRRASIVWDTSDSPASFIETAASEIKARVSAVLIDEKCKHVYCGKDDGTVNLHDLENGNEVAILYKHKSKVHVLALWSITTTNTLMSVDESNSVVAWSLPQTHRAGTETGAQVFQFRLDCGNTISQLLPGSAHSKFILSTRESDHLWDFSEPREHTRISHANLSIHKWVQHPKSLEQVLCTNGSWVRIYTWNDWTQITDISLPIDMAGLQTKSIIPCLMSRNQKIWVELSELHGGADSRELHILDMSPIPTITTASNNEGAASTMTAAFTRNAPAPIHYSTAQLPRAFTSLISHIIGLSPEHQKLIFLNRHSWVCSISLDQKPGNLKIFQYSRHFFVPYDWFSGARGVICVLSRRNVVFARNDCVAIVKGGFDFSETVTIEL